MKIVIDSERTRREAVEAVKKITSTPIMVVTIAEYSDDRSNAQNRLYWSWITDISRTSVNEHAGNTKDYWHSFFKQKSLLNIFIRDDVNSTAATMAALYEVKQQCGIEVYLNMRNFVIDNISTTDCSVKQFTEYLTDIQRWCSGVGVSLRTDSADFKRAMGG